MNQNPERMAELVKVTNPVVMLYSSYSEEGVEGDLWQKVQNERGRRGVASGFHVADPGELAKLNHKSP